MLDHMFHIPLPLLEKIIRPILVYVTLIVLLRIFGKRELAQLNPFDLVVLLSLSNTVQNAIIGDDNSLLGGVVGAISLLSANWIVNRVLFRMPGLNQLLQGTKTVLVRDGMPDKAAMKRELLTHEELVEVLHKQSVQGLRDVKLLTLEPGGTFYLETRKDSLPGARHDMLIAKLEELSAEIRALKKQS